MSWLTWRHPDMPWVATEAWVGDILPDGTVGNPTPGRGRARRVGVPAGMVASTGISISYRTEVRAGGISIARTTARSSQWRRWTPNSGDRNGSSACRPTRSSSADRLISCFVRDGVWTLAGIDTRSKRFDVIPTDFTDIAQLRAAPGRVVFIGGSSSEAPALVDLDLNNGNSPRLASLVRPSRGGPPLCL